MKAFLADACLLRGILGARDLFDTRDGITSWAVCNHPASLSPRSFAQFNRWILLLPKDDFNQVLERLMKWLPNPFSLDTQSIL
jgi:hypothetical protein